MPYSYTITDFLTLNKTVHFGASESGGYQNVTISEPINITVTVDDSAFEVAVSACSNELLSLSSVLISSQLRQENAKKESAKKISESIIKGFLDHNITSFKVLSDSLKNEADAAFPKIDTFFKQLKEIKERMEGDYNQIGSRYVNIFSSFDDELRRCMKRINDPCFALFNDLEKSIKRRESSALALGFDDISRAQSVLALAPIKDNLKKVMDDIIHLLLAEKELERKIKDLRESGEIDECSTLFLPIIFFEREDVEKDKRMLDCSINFPFSSSSEERLKDEAFKALKDGTLNIGDDEKGNELVEMEFMKMAQGIEDENKRTKVIALYESYKRGGV